MCSDSTDGTSMQAGGWRLSACVLFAGLASTAWFSIGAQTPDIHSDLMCGASGELPANPFGEPHWNGWGVTTEQRRFQTQDMAQLPPADVPRLKVKWAFGFQGATTAYAQPTVVAGRLYVGSSTGFVYALDAATGCEYWRFKASAPVRTAITIGRAGTHWAAFFGDRKAAAYAVDAESGALLWKTTLDLHEGAMVTGAPTLGRQLYVPVSSGEEALGGVPNYECCSFRGSLSSLDPATGAINWKTYTIPATPQPRSRNKLGVQLWGPSGGAIFSAPTLDPRRNVVYVTTGNSYSLPLASTTDSFIAIDTDTGKMLWSQQMTRGDATVVDCRQPEWMRFNCPQADIPDFDFTSSAILVDLRAGRRALVAGQKSGVVHAIDPDRRGAVLWQTRIGLGGPFGGVQWGSAADLRHFYVALSDVLVETVPIGTPGSRPTTSNVAIRMSPGTGGGLFALSLESGTVVWRAPHPGCAEAPTCGPAQSSAVTAIPGVVFSGGLDGHLRAYAAEDGRVIWDVNTARSYETVNRVAAIGGSLDGPGPVIVAGMLFVNSGYGQFASAPGNVLLAFSVEGR